MAVLEVDDVQDTVADQQAVAGTEATGHPPAHVHHLLDEHPRAAGKARPQLVDEADVQVGGFEHFRRNRPFTTVPVVHRVKGVAILPACEVVPEGVFAQLMRPGALCGVLSLFVRQTLGGSGTGGAGDPPGCAGCTQQGVFKWRHLRPPRLST